MTLTTDISTDSTTDSNADGASKAAATGVPLHPLLAQRWSPRAFDPDHELDPSQLTALLEAARWSPSAANTQPWRFAVARRGTPEHDALVEALAEGNRVWARDASALLVAAAQTVAPDGQPRPWARYDTGQAVAHLSVQAQHEGLVVHQMGGFDPARVGELLGDSAGLVPQAVVAVGWRGDTAQLPEALAEREAAIRERLPLDDLLIDLAASTASAA